MAQTEFVIWILFLIVWLTIVGSYLYFAFHVAPSSLRRWAGEQGYSILEKRLVMPPDWFRHAKGSGHQLYRLVIVDEAGQTRRGMALVGNPYWFCLSVRQCPVEVRWESPGEGRRKKPLSRRVVVGFAIADLVLAAFEAFWVVGILLVVAFVADDIWNGALGVNRLLGRVPQPNLWCDWRLSLGGVVGYLALHVVAFVALTAGGVGLIRRKRWGFYAHVMGSALVACTGIGILYTIPSVAIALTPGLRDGFLDQCKTGTKPEPIGDL